MPAPEELRLDERLCLALYNASRAMTARYRPLLDGLDLTYPQYLVMVALWEDGAQSVGTLGARLRLDSGTLSPLLKRLEAAGHIARHRDPSDQRLVIVSVTARGRGLRRRAAGVPSAICDAAGMPLDDQLDLVAELSALVDRLDASSGRPHT